MRRVWAVVQTEQNAVGSLLQQYLAEAMIIRHPDVVVSVHTTRSLIRIFSGRVDRRRTRRNPRCRSRPHPVAALDILLARHQRVHWIQPQPLVIV